MKRFINIKQASELTGLSIYALREGVRTGRLPHTRAGSNKSGGKLLFDIDALTLVLQQEVYDGYKQQPSIWDEEEPQQKRSIIADIFKNMEGDE